MINQSTTDNQHAYLPMTTHQKEPTSSPFAYKNANLLLENAELHIILEENWQALPQRFPGIKLDDFVIMPDHVHFILWLTSHLGNVPTLGEVVGAYKSLTGRASLANLRMQHHIHASQFWQRGFYEHVIRNEFELQQRRAYIRNNPLKEDLKTNNQH